MNRKILQILSILIVTLGLAACFDSDDDDKNYNNDEVYENLHVKSPNWEDQVIYFVLTDRFNDGDPTNNSQGMGEYNPYDLDYYSGGDIQGIIDQVDYIKNLGATAVWISPPVANQWLNPLINVTGYHGYWARNFKTVDEHFGTLNTYKNLSNTLHNNGMYLIQDIVPNHTGNFFTYGNGYNPDDLEENFQLIDNSIPSMAPTQYPFNMNDYTNPEHREANIYHWTPEITDYTDPIQEKYYQMGILMI